MPTHYFKALVATSVEGTRAHYVASFILPNARIPEDTKLSDFEVPMEEIERLSGISLFPRLARDAAAPLCEEQQHALCTLPKARWYESKKRGGDESKRRGGDESNACADNASKTPENAGTARATAA